MSGNPKQRLTLTNLTEPQQLRELNRQLTWIWDQLLGGLSMKSLHGNARAVIDSKASGEIVDELGNVVGQHSTRLLQTDEKIQTLAESIETVDGKIKEQATSVTQTAESIESLASRVDQQAVVNFLTDGEAERTLERIDSNATSDYAYDERLNGMTDTEFVFSCEAKSEPAGMGADFCFRDASGTKISDGDSVTLTEEYRQYARVITLSGSYTAKSIDQCRFRALSGSGTISVKNARLERRDTGDVRLLETRVVQNAESITQKAEKTEVSALATRVSTAEQKITADAIVSTVTQSEKYTGDQEALQGKIDTAQNDADINAAKINGLTERVTSAETQITQTAQSVKSVAERVETLENAEGGGKILAEMEDGSVSLAQTYIQVASFTAETLGVSAGDEITWSVYAAPDVQKNIGLNVTYSGEDGTLEDPLGDLTLLSAGEERRISFATTVPEGATIIRLYFYDNSAATGGAGAVIAYRDSVVKKGADGDGEYVLRSEFEQTASSIRAEVSKKQNAGDPATGVDTKAGVVIDAEGVRMHGANIEMETSDGDGYARLSSTGFSASSVQAPDVAPRYAGPNMIYIDPDTAKEGEIIPEDGIPRYTYRSLADAASRLSGHMLDRDVAIYLYNVRQEYANVQLSGVFGTGRIFLRGNYGGGSNYRLNGQLHLNQCAVGIEIEKLDVASALIQAVTLTGCQYVKMDGCALTARSVPLTLEEGTKASIENTSLNGDASSAAAAVQGCSHANFCGTTGNGQLRVSGGGVMLVSGTTPTGGAASVDTGSGGGLYADVGVTGGAGADAPTVETVLTADILARKTDSYGLRGGWTCVEDNDVRQGWSTGTGQIFGCMWFDVSGLAGRTVKQASLRLCKARDDLGGTGRGTTVSVHLYGTTLTGASGSLNAGVLTDYGEIGTVSPGAPNVITIPKAAAQDLIDGEIGGLVVYCPGESSEYKSGKGYSRNYMRFYGDTSGDESSRPMLTVAYA